MKTKLHLTTLLAIFCMSINAQTTFQKTYGGTGTEINLNYLTLQPHGFNNILQTTDSGYVITGATTSFSAGSSLYVVKTNQSGDTLWTKIYTDSVLISPYAIIQTYDDGYLILAHRADITAPVNYCCYMFLIRTNSVGDTLWTRAFNSNNVVNTYDDIPATLQQTADSGFIAAGTIGGTDPFFAKFDKYGNFQWKKTYFSYGATFHASIQQTTDDGYIVGAFRTNPSNGDTYTLLKLDQNGDTLWSKEYFYFDGAIFSGHKAFYVPLNSTIQTNDGGYILLGSIANYDSTITVYDLDICLLKTDSNGDTLWTKVYGSSNTEFCYSIEETTDGGYILGGVTGDSSMIGDPLLIRVFL